MPCGTEDRPRIHADQNLHVHTNKVEYSSYRIRVYPGESKVRLESALVRPARNQFTWEEMGRLRIVEW